MDRQLPTDPPDRRVSELARRQHGVVERAQLIALGVSRDAIEGRVKRGMLHSVHRGVYAVGHLALTRHGAFMAAVLACGEGAALSHFSAAVAGWRVIRVTSMRLFRQPDALEAQLRSLLTPAPAAPAAPHPR